MTAIALEIWHKQAAAVRTEAANRNIPLLHTTDKRWKYWPGAKGYTPVLPDSPACLLAFEKAIKEKTALWLRLVPTMRSYKSVKIPCEARIAVLETAMIDLEPSPVTTFFKTALNSVNKELETDERIFAERFRRFYAKFPAISELTEEVLKTKTEENLTQLITMLKTERAYTDRVRKACLQAHTVHQQRYATLGHFATALSYAEARVKDPAIPYVTLVDLLNPENQVKIAKADFPPAKLIELWKMYCQIVMGYGNEDGPGAWLPGKRIFLDRWVSSLSLIEPLFAQGLEAAHQFRSHLKPVVAAAEAEREEPFQALMEAIQAGAGSKRAPSPPPPERDAKKRHTDIAPTAVIKVPS